MEGNDFGTSLERAVMRYRTRSEDAVNPGCTAFFDTATQRWEGVAVDLTGFESDEDQGQEIQLSEISLSHEAMAALRNAQKRHAIMLQPYAKEPLISFFAGNLHSLDACFPDHISTLKKGEHVTDEPEVVDIYIGDPAPPVLVVVKETGENSMTTDDLCCSSSEDDDSDDNLNSTRGRVLI